MPVLESPKEIGVDSPGPGVGKGAWFHTPLSYILVHAMLHLCICECGKLSKFLSFLWGFWVLAFNQLGKNRILESICLHCVASFR